VRREVAACIGSVQLQLPCEVSADHVVQQIHRALNEGALYLRFGQLSMSRTISNVKDNKQPRGASVSSLTFCHQLVHRLDERLDGVHAMVKRGLFLRVELQLDNPFHTARA
jgi:hypothetical protein